MTAQLGREDFPGHEVVMPARWTSPVVFACPHAGRRYPASFTDSSRLSLLELRRSEDAYVDALLPSADEVGVPILRADFPRAFVDVNRAPYELDPFLFDAPVGADRTRSGRVLAGFGVIPKLAAEGRAIYARKLPAQEARARIKWCYEPYHAAMRELITACLTRFGEATVVDWHSMPSVGAGRRLPPVVLGDRFGASCGEGTAARWEEAFGEVGLSVTRNSPYAGGYVTSLYGRPREGVHVLQVELNRSLYMDEVAVTRTRGFERTRERVASVAARALSWSQGGSLAAE